MVPRIAKIGHSFKGAGLYYLHDKKAATKDRVVWTHTHNIPTDNPDKAFNWMAYTSMNAHKLKQQAGVPMTGRKSKVGSVYSFSLAWHPEQNPDKQTMLNAALETLGLLRLENHEAVMVAHNDTAHPHVHVICNLVNPETGKKAVMSYDRLTLSTWAEGVERNDGQILCEQRVINNERRRRTASLTRQFGMVKHRDQKLQFSSQVQHLYEMADSGNAFKSALEQEGLKLAKGERRGFVLVDKDDKVYALARQLKGQRAKDIKTRLHDIEDLPLVQDILHPPSFDRDDYETQRQKNIVDAAIEETTNPSQPKETENRERTDKPELKYDEKHLKKLDALRAWEQNKQRLKSELKEQQGQQYDRKSLLAQIKELETQISSNKGLWSKLSGNLTTKQKELTTLKQNLSNIDQRIEEQNAAFEKKTEQDKPNLNDEEEAIRQKRVEYIRRMQEHRGRSDNRDKGPDIER